MSSLQKLKTRYGIRSQPLWLRDPYWANKIHPGCVTWLVADRGVRTSLSATSQAGEGAEVNYWIDQSDAKIPYETTYYPDPFTAGSPTVKASSSRFYPIPSLEFEEANIEELYSGSNPLLNTDNFTAFLVGVTSTSTGGIGPFIGRGLDFYGAGWSIVMAPNMFIVVMTNPGISVIGVSNTYYPTNSRFVNAYRCEQGQRLKWYQRYFSNPTITITSHTTLRNSTVPLRIGAQYCH